MRIDVLNYPFVLELKSGRKQEGSNWSDPEKVLIGSEIEPVKVFENDESSPYSRNGDDIYIERGYLVQQRGQYILVVQRIKGWEHFDLGSDLEYDWEAYEMPPVKDEVEYAVAEAEAEAEEEA